MAFCYVRLNCWGFTIMKISISSFVSCNAKTRHSKFKSENYSRESSIFLYLMRMFITPTWCAAPAKWRQCLNYARKNFSFRCSFHCPFARHSETKKNFHRQIDFLVRELCVPVWFRRMCVNRIFLRQKLNKRRSLEAVKYWKYAVKSIGWAIC